MWAAAAEMAQRYGLHDTAKVLRLEAMRLKQRLPEGTSAQPAATRFLELLTPATAGPAECVVEVESSRGRMRVAMKGVAPDWGGLLRAWRETAG